MPVKVDVHGSCASRNCFNNHDDTEVKVNRYFARNNIASAMMPPAEIPFKHGDLKRYTSEYNERCMKSALYKDTVPLLMESDAEWLAIDFYDFSMPAAGYKNTTFSTYDYTYYNSDFYQNNSSEFCTVDFLNLPICLWYGYVDAYFEKVTKKYRGVILTRLDLSSIYIDNDNRVRDVPENKLPFGNPAYNAPLYALENYVIDRYKLYTIDISKFFLPNENDETDVTPVHYENYFLNRQYELIKSVVLNRMGEIPKYIDTVKPDMAADILSRPISDGDFNRVYSLRQLPFSTDTLLDFVLSNIELKDINKNRAFIAALYREYGRLSVNTINGKGRIPRLKPLLSSDLLWKDKANSSFKDYIYEYLNKMDGLLSLSPEALFENFKKGLSAGIKNMDEWMPVLNLIKVTYPNFGGLPLYLEQVNQIFNNEYALRKLRQNYPPLNGI